MGDDQEERARRRLLQQLQQRVGGGAVHVLGGIDDGDAPAALGRARAEAIEHAADGIDGNVAGVALAIGLLDAAQHMQVRDGTAP
jgi:uncharacterized protein (DUF779 family)